MIATRARKAGAPKPVRSLSCGCVRPHVHVGLAKDVLSVILHFCKKRRHRGWHPCGSAAGEVLARSRPVAPQRWGFSCNTKDGAARGLKPRQRIAVR